MDRRGRERVLPRTTAAGEPSPTAETALLACAFFLVQHPLSLVGLVGLFGLSPAVLVEPWILVTSVYAHGGPGHLLANLLGLVLAGAVVERVTTRLRFHAFFVSTGALAGLAEVVPGSLSTLAPRGVLGASGAVFALPGYAIAGNGPPTGCWTPSTGRPPLAGPSPRSWSSPPSCWPSCSAVRAARS